MTAPRRTLARPATVSGLGLFCEAQCSVTIRPALAGIVLTRRGVSIPATIEHLSSHPAHAAFETMPPRSTSLDLADGTVILTVEHLLSALAGLGVSAAEIEIEGPELPIGDGSAQAFTAAMLEAGLVDLDEQPAPLPGSLAAFTVGDPGDPHGPRIEVTPAPSPSFVYHLDYGSKSPIPAQHAQWDGTPEAYTREIAPARTYCLDYEAQAMHDAGLFKSFTPRDLLVIGKDGPIDNAYRFENEPARHKLLDLIGDVALAGLPLAPVRIEAFGSGHALNHEVARRLACSWRGTV
jgi:UDP-3-O-acyl-N-acetylglucosamine deacetylase